MRSPTLLPNLLLLPFLFAVASCIDKERPAENGPITLSPPRLEPGQTVRTTAKTIARGGRFTASSPDANAGGTLSLERLRIVEKTFGEPDGSGASGFSLVVVEDSLGTTVQSDDGERADTVKSPLIGRPISAAKSADGKWKLQLTTGESGPAEEEELIPLEGFENRNWLPSGPVRPGDSWNFDPVYFRSLIERDLGAAAATGVMKLLAIEILENGGKIARIDLTITTTGAEQPNVETQLEASIEAAGSLVIDLETMLETKMTIEGTLVSSAADATSQASVELPVRIEMTREVVP